MPSDTNRPEELDLSGATPPKSGTTSAQQASTADQAEQVNLIKANAPDLRHLVTPGQTNEELVNSILALNPENLITWEECHLPSKGLYYGWPDGMVHVKAMGQTAEKILATQRLAESGQSMDYLFRECVRFPNGFMPEELLLGDRIFLLYYLRGITHGNIYEFAITCPNNTCEAVSTHQYDLNELAGTMVQANESLGREPFKVVLPYLSKSLGKECWVGVRFLRAADANDMLAKRKARKKMMAQPGGVKNKGRMSQTRDQRNQNQQLDDTISQNLEKIIVSVMGVGDVFAIRQFITQMHAQDTAAVREWLRDNTPGIDNTVSVECPDCNREFTVELPITDSFFRPAKSNRV